MWFRGTCPPLPSLVLGAALLAACSPPAPHAPPTVAPAAFTPPAPVPARPATIDLAALRARESSAELRPFPVKKADGSPAFAVPAIRAPKVEHDAKTHTVTSHFDIQGGAQVECTLLADQVDPGAFARRLIQIPEDASGTIEAHALVVDHRPVVLVEGMMSWGPEDQRTAAGPKIAIARLHAGSMVCVHDEIGYLTTFERVVRAVMASIERARDEPRPRFRETSQMTVNGVAVGTLDRAVYDRPDGTRANLQLGMLLHLAGGKLHAVDLAQVEVLDPAGRLAEQTVTMSNDGELITKLSAARLPNGEYVVEGKLDGKDVKSRLKAATPPLTDITRAPRLRAVADGKSAQESFVELDTSVSPALLRSWTATRATGRAVTLVSGAEKRTCEVDAAGLCATSTILAGDAAGLGSRRVDVEGAL